MRLHVVTCMYWCSLLMMLCMVSNARYAYTNIYTWFPLSSVNFQPSFLVFRDIKPDNLLLNLAGKFYDYKCQVLVSAMCKHLTTSKLVITMYHTPYTMYHVPRCTYTYLCRTVQFILFTKTIQFLFFNYMHKMHFKECKFSLQDMCTLQILMLLQD